MAFTLDNHDPLASGMFSKPGRFTSEKYIIFQKKDEIINNQRKFLKVSALPHLKMDFDGKDAKTLPEEDVVKTKTVSAKNTARIEPFAQQLSREEFYETKKVKNPPPPFGFYNPRHDYVERTPQTLFKYEKERKKDKFRTTMTDFSIDEASRPLPDKLHKKVVGPIQFHLQKGKGTLLSPKNNPHEDRFNYLVIPGNCGRSKKLRDVQMNKSMGRDYKFLIKDLEYAPDYDVNFEAGRKRLGSCGAPFERNSPRKPMHFVSTCTNENFYDTSKNETLKFFTPQKTGFDGWSPRHSDSLSPLPSFMQKTINSRIAVGTLRQKTLEINGFSDGKFQTVHSGFSSPKRSAKKE